MRLNTCALLLIPIALLLAKSDPAGNRPIEIRTSNGPVEVIGADIDQVRGSSNEADGRPIRVEVPRRSAIHVVTSNGAIRISGVTGALDLITSNGPIVIEDAGTSEVKAHTSNGSIEIGLAAPVAVKLSARTSNGHIHSDFPVVSHEIGANFLEGQIGPGGPLIQLQTSNGAIRIRGAGTQTESVTSRFTPGEVK